MNGSKPRDHYVQVEANIGVHADKYEAVGHFVDSLTQFVKDYMDEHKFAMHLGAVSPIEVTVTALERE